MMNSSSIDDAIRYFELLHHNIRRRGGEPPAEEVTALNVLKETKQTMLVRGWGA